MIVQLKEDKVVATYRTATEAVKKTGITGIHNCLSGRYSQSGGFKWKREK